MLTGSQGVFVSLITVIAVSEAVARRAVSHIMFIGDCRRFKGRHGR